MEIRKSFLPFFIPSIGQEEIDEVIDTLRSDWITTGPKTNKFEQEFSDYVGASASLALNSCTAALHLTLATLGIEPNDEVITTPMTFASSVNIIEHLGAKPVLVDVESDTLNISPEGIEKSLTEKTKAVITVHYAGHPVDMNPIRVLTQNCDFEIIEDASHALPAKLNDQLVGSTENPVCFSFYATKNITTAEGGMLTGDPDFLDQARIISLHGMSRDAWRRYNRNESWYYEVVIPGFKYNMTDIQASLGLWQLRKLDGFYKRRREIAAAYNEAFRDVVTLEVPVERQNCQHAWHLYVLRLHLDALRIDRDRFIEEMSMRNVGTSVHFIPIHLHPYYQNKYGYEPEDFPEAYKSYLRMLSLPLHPRLTDEDVAYVIESVLDIVEHSGL
jgi:dTDP-4-amino-4,6-dideoxygalactose transaminase